MSKIILFDPIYSGHHVSYAKSLKMSTKNTILVVNKNKKDLFNDIPSEKKIILNCKDPYSFKILFIGWLINIYHLLLNTKLRKSIVHFLYADSIIHYIFLYMLLSRKPFYLTIHWCSSVVPLNKDNRSYVERLFRMLKEYVFSLVGKRALAIFCHGEFSKRAIERTYPELNIVKIPYGIEPKAGREKVFSRKKKTQERTTVLFFGGIRTDKGIEQLSELTRLCPDIHFIVAGKPMGYTKSEIENLFKGRNNVELILDFIRDEDVEELFLKADILILPYNKHFAGQSGPLTISTIYRVPVVAARVGDMGEDIERYGLGVTTDSNDPLLLKEALTVILNMDLEKLQKAHDEYYLRGLWTNVGKLIEEYYNKSEIKPI